MRRQTKRREKTLGERDAESHRHSATPGRATDGGAAARRALLAGARSGLHLHALRRSVPGRRDRRRVGARCGSVARRRVRLRDEGRSGRTAYRRRCLRALRPMRHGVPHRRAFGDSTARRRRAVGSERAGGSRGGEAGGGFCSGRGRGSGRFDRDARCGSPGRGSASRSRSRLRWIRVRARPARGSHRCRAYGRPSLYGVGGRSAHRAHGVLGRAAHRVADGSVRLVRVR